MVRDTSDPAFPTQVGRGALPLQTGDNSFQMPGMTLRDYFAAKALAAILASPNCPKSVEETLVADGCYLFADAMLAAREPKDAAP